jgi:hypothetical protein
MVVDTLEAGIASPHENTTHERDTSDMSEESVGPGDDSDSEANAPSPERSVSN